MKDHKMNSKTYICLAKYTVSVHYFFLNLPIRLNGAVVS